MKIDFSSHEKIHFSNSHIDYRGERQILSGFGWHRFPLLSRNDFLLTRKKIIYAQQSRHSINKEIQKRSTSKSDIEVDMINIDQNCSTFDHPFICNKQKVRK